MSVQGVARLEVAMAAVSLAILVGGFRRTGLRAWTGSNGKPVLERLTELGLFGLGALVVARSVFFAFAAPSASDHFPCCRPLFWSAPIVWAGACCMGLALVLLQAALRDMGISWRIGIERSGASALVTTGVFAHSRNPIFVALLLALAGMALAERSLFAATVAVVGAAGIHRQVLREERHLSHCFGANYGRYKSCVARYVSLRCPGWKRRC